MKIMRYSLPDTTLVSSLWRAIVSGLLLSTGLAIVLATAATAYALNASAVSITGITPFAALDSNNSCTAGPRAMFVQVNVKNISAAALTGISTKLGGFTNAQFALASGEQTDRYIGVLAAGATASLFWYVDYPCTIDVATTYTVGVVDNTAGIVSSSPLSLTTRSEISAQAGGDVATVNLGQGAVVGQIVPYTVSYAFGNPAASADAMIQPAGNVNFDSACYRLISDDIVASNFTAGPLTTADNQLYFTSVAGASSNAITVVYRFLARCTGVSSPAAPFADLKSGTQVKYTSNFSTSVAVITFPPASNAFSISKSASAALLPAGGAVVYTVTVSNSSPFVAFADRVVDTLPSGATFGGMTASSQLTAGNSSISPTVDASGVLTWTGIPLSSYAVPANGTLLLVYTATITSTPGVYANAATVTAGSVNTGPAATPVTVGSADMALSIAAPITTVVNTPLQYSLSITNHGTTDATGVVVSDTLPAGATFGSATPSQGSCSFAAGIVTCTLGSMANGGTASITLIVTPTTSGTITDTARVWAAQFDPVMANNPASQQVEVDTLPTAVTLLRIAAGASDPLSKEMLAAGLFAGGAVVLLGVGRSRRRRAQRVSAPPTR
jgi:uncharacterized repeat protein (TIGR01451 family)